MDSSVRYLLETRQNPIIVSGVVTTIFAYLIYILFKWVNKRLVYSRMDPYEYFENIENSVSLKFFAQTELLMNVFQILVDQYSLQIHVHVSLHSLIRQLRTNVECMRDMLRVSGVGLQFRKS